MFRWLFARTAFYPSILWNQLLFRIVPGRAYWDVIDDTVVMGAMPLPQHAAQLYALGVRGVVNMCEEYAGPTEAYRIGGLTQLHLPTIDFTAPSYDAVTRGVAFIREHAARNEKVYVHCKAGRGRSATLVLCWLMEREKIDAEEAQRRLVARRRQVVSRLWKRAVVQRWGRELSAATT
jgi:atypical dual specificity phosphatase